VGVAGDPAAQPVDPLVVWGGGGGAGQVGLGGPGAALGDLGEQVGRVGDGGEQAGPVAGAAQVVGQVVPDVGLVRRQLPPPVRFGGEQRLVGGQQVGVQDGQVVGVQQHVVMLQVVKRDRVLAE
jgi:hypothetical protein